jgi:hypothetical protein
MWPQTLQRTPEKSYIRAETWLCFFLSKCKILGWLLRPEAWGLCFPGAHAASQLLKAALNQETLPWPPRLLIPTMHLLPKPTPPPPAAPEREAWVEKPIVPHPSYSIGLVKLQSLCTHWAPDSSHWHTHPCWKVPCTAGQATQCPSLDSGLNWGVLGLLPTHQPSAQWSPG